MVKISDEAYEELRLILEGQYGHPFTLEEAKEIGDGLVDFYAYLERLAIQDGIDN